jgi:ABC-type amino acid transport substrate-binding protein
VQKILRRLAPIAAMLVILICVNTTYAQTPQFPSSSRLKSITDAKLIKVAYRADARPFSFVNDKKEVVGFTIDLCHLIVRSIAREFKIDDLKVEWVPVTLATRFSAVADGKADMECGSSTVTLSRMKEVDFSSFTFIESTGVLVNKGSNIRAFSDLTGKRIAVISGTTNEHAIQAQLKERNIAATLVAVNNRTEGVGMLEAGTVDGYASDKLLLLGADIKHPELLVMLPDDLSVEPYAIALPRGDWAFRLAVNTGLAEIYRSGEVATVVNTWFQRVGLYTGPILKIMYGIGALSE